MAWFLQQSIIAPMRDLIKNDAQQHHTHDG